jgi:6-phosphogluconolactonase (cycloisomerase 2 family)
MLGTWTRTLVLALAVGTTTASALRSDESGSRDAPGAVYALTNSPAGNAVVVYERRGDGSLRPAGSYATGGAGTGTGLGSQGAVVLSDDARLLFAVNPGSNSVSSFRVRSRGLELVDTEPSGGVTPTSLAFRDRGVFHDGDDHGDDDTGGRGLLYVLNAGVPNSVSGFTVDRHGKITPLEGSTRPLSAASTAPAQVGFSDDGEVVVVTERATNRIDTYLVGADGRLGAPLVHASAGPTPFGFAVNRRDTLFVSEAGAGGGASSYRIAEDGSLEVGSSNVMTGQRAACWAVVTKNGRYGYVTNAGTGNISGFEIARGGTASLLDADGVTAVTGGNPTDAALSRSSRYLYVLVNALNEIAIFRIAGDGSLEALPSLTGTSGALAGLAAY